MIEKKKKIDKDKWILSIPALILLCIGFYVAYSYVRPAPPKQFSIATGSVNGAYTYYAKQYAQFMEKQGVKLDIITSKGSLENLSLLRDKDNDIDVAFVQSGVTKGNAPDNTELEGVASIYREPLWVFVKKNANLGLIRELKGLRIGTSEVGSGSFSAAMTLLKDNAVTINNSHIVSGTEDQLTQQLQNEQLDAVMLVGAAQSGTIQRFLNNPDLKIHNLQLTDAYVRRHPMFSQVILPRGAIDPANDMPPADIQMISPVAALVVNKQIHPALVSLLLQAAHAVHGKPTLFDGANEFPSENYLDFPVSERAERYFEKGPPLLQRYMPFWAAIMIDRLVILLLPLVTLMIPLIKVIPPLYRWRVRSRIYSWYEQLLTIEQGVIRNSDEKSVKNYLQALDNMEQEVNDIEVPLSYADSKYNLRLHIALVREQIHKQLE